MNLVEQQIQTIPPFPDLALWSENFCLVAHDTTSGIGLWFHLGRWRRDLTVWRETVVINMPDETVLGHRAYGNAKSNEVGPGGSNYWIRI